MSNLPAISFGMIVLNGQPFLTYNLRALYPYASQIIVVEGAVAAAAELADSHGHSIDGTLEALWRFKEEEDPQDKLEIVTRGGHWTEKDEQSQAYAQRAHGDYLWQVDVDEFYQPGDVTAVLAFLQQNPAVTMLSFPHLLFWGSPDYRVNGWYLMREQAYIRRVFKWGSGYRYSAHRPPEVLDEQGRALSTLHPAGGADFARRGIYMYHYSLLFPEQVRSKSRYYEAASWSPLNQATRWSAETFEGLRRPYRVHNSYQYPSWLERATMPPPPQVQALLADIAAGHVTIQQRDMADVERLLTTRWYGWGARLLQGIEPVARAAILARRRWRRWRGQ